MTAVDTALAPLRAALLAAARADAATATARARDEAAAVLAAAQEEAGTVLAQAHRQGLADAAVASAAERAQARRFAHQAVLRARAEAYERLRAAARDAVTALDTGPDGPALRERLADEARRVLGARARLGPADGGGLIADDGRRHLNLSLTGFADRAVEALHAEEDHDGAVG